MKSTPLKLFGLGLAAACAAALAHGPHVHGTGELQVVVENNTLHIELHGPLENLLGFEHAPRTGAQRAAVKAMTDKLNRPETLFRLPKAASCTAGPVRIESPLTGAPAAPSKSAGTAHGDDDDHADLAADFGYTCADIARLDSIEVTIFDAFPGTRTLKAAIIGPRGQSAATLTPGRRVIRF